MRIPFKVIVLALIIPTFGFAQSVADARKAASVAQLQSDGIPVLNSLPVIEDEDQSIRRRQEDVVRRTIALAIVAVKGETGDHAMGQRLIAQYGAKGYFTPAEQAFMDNPAPAEQDRTHMTWRYEGVHVMLWALGIYNDLGRPDQITDVPLLAETLRDLGPDGLRAAAQLRPQAELLDAADLIYRTHWAVVQARLDGTAPPAGLYPGVVYERHYALNWLIGYRGQAWDDISTDT